MKYFIGVLGCIVLVITLTSVTQAAVFSNEIDMQAEIPEGTWTVGLGETAVQGSLYGFKNEEISSILKNYAEDPLISSYINPDILTNPHLFPLTGVTSFDDIENVTLIPISLLESLTIENAMQFVTDIQFFSDVSLSVQQDLSVLVTSGKKMDFNLEQASTLSGILPFSFGNITDQISFFSIADTNITAHYYYDGSTSIIYPYVESLNIDVLDSEGNTIWNNQQEEYIIILSNPFFSFTDSSLYHIFPLLHENKVPIFSMRLRPAEIPPDIQHILSRIQSISENFEDINIPFIDDQITTNNVVDSLSSLLNGGLIFVNITKSVNIDESDQSFESIGFNRVEDASISLSSSQNLQVDGEFRLIFLGNHIYNPQAPSTENGLAFPIFPIILWIVAVGILIYFYITKIKKEAQYKIGDKPLLYLCIIIHIFGLLIAFILYDYEISYQFGNSFMQEVSMHGFTLIGLIFGGFQTFMWVIGFVFAALPLGIITKKLLIYFGFDRSYQHIGKGIASLSIWPIATIYTTMFINIIFLFFNPVTSFI